jgi:hypothetical protein
MHSPVTRPPFTARAGRALSVGQEALWFFQQLSPQSSAYNVAGGVNLHFPVDVVRMAAAVQETAARHSMLNCVFRATGDSVRRKPAALDAVRLLAVHDLDLDDESLQAFALRFTQQPFRLDRQPPIRFVLIRRPDRPAVLLMAAHHIAADYTSQLLILQEILTVYAGGEPGADTGDDFDEFVRRQREYLASRRATAAETYWRGEWQRAGASADLPTDHRRPAVYQFAGSQVAFDFPAGMATDVERAAAARNTTVFVYLLSAFQYSLAAFSGQTDFLLGYPVTVRPARFARSIGYFVNTLPLHAQVDPGDSFTALVETTGDKVLRGLFHRDYPFALMPRLLDTRRAPDQAGLISMMFAMTAHDPEQPWSTLPAPGTRTEIAGLSISEFPLPQQQGQFDLTLQVFRPPTGAHAALKYNTSLFTTETARALADDYVRTLRSATDGTLDEGA